MGSIRVRQGRYQANVRRKGYAPVTKTFTSREVAKRWIKSTEIAIDFRWHDLRHEATSRLFEKSLNLMEVATITGHQDLKMLKRYTHLRAEDLMGRLG